MNNIIDIAYIYEYATKLNNDRENIKTYINRIERVIGNTNTETTSNIKKLLDDIDYEITELYRLLMIEIIPGYEETSQSIKKSFNVDFHDQMNNLLNTIKE